MIEAKSYVSFDPFAQDYDISRGIPLEAQIEICGRMRDAADWQPGEFFLDAGAGTGRFAVPLARLGVPVVGVEISANMLARLRANCEAACREDKKHLPLRAVQGDLRRMGVVSSAFKAVLIVHILHLIADWKSVLYEVKRVLKPGGVLLLARQGGRGSPVHEFCYELARERELLAPVLGGANEEVCAYLAEQGAQIETIDMSDITWTSRRLVSFTLELLRRGTWSSLRQISESDNAALVTETAAWALARYGSLDAVEEEKGACSLLTVRWS